MKHNKAKNSKMRYACSLLFSPTQCHKITGAKCQQSIARGESGLSGRFIQQVNQRGALQNSTHRHLPHRQCVLKALYACPYHSTEHITLQLLVWFFNCAPYQTVTLRARTTLDFDSLAHDQLFKLFFFN